jgi:ech hydrogenase subunit F
MFDKVKQQIKAKRGQLQVDSGRCTHCGICQKKCPAKAITVSPLTKEWHVNDEKCVRCGRCVRICPNSALMIVRNQ